jgi:hypothetical protein
MGDENMMFGHVRAVKRMHEKELLADRNVVGVGIGYKEVGGVKTNEPCIIVSVVKKVPSKYVNPERLVPLMLGGVMTDVQETGVFWALQERTDKWRPAPGGISIGHHCFDEKTRVLTRNGLRFFHKLSRNEEIATLNPETGFLEYQKPSRLFSYEYKGDMIHFRGITIDLLVTPNHNLYFKNRQGSNDFSLAPAEQVLEENPWANIQFKRNAKWHGTEGNDFFEIPPQTEKRCAFEAFKRWGGTMLEFSRHWPVSYKTVRRWNKGTHAPGVLQSPQRFVLNDWLAFLGWYLSEGSTGPRGGVRISEKSGQYHDEILALLNRMGLNAFVASSGDVGFAHTELSLYLKQFGTAKKKYVPSDVKDLPTENLIVLLDSLMKGDGHFENGKYRHYKSSSKQLAMDVFEIALKCGYGVTIQEYQNKGHQFGKRWIRGGTHYRIGFSHVKKTPRLAIEPKLIDYDGNIYCLEVPNHILFVERNGKTCWSGNSITAGTLGCLVQRGGETFILSNNHVLAASNQAEIGDPILQPGTADDGTMPGDQIGTLEDFVEVKFLLDQLPECPTAKLVASAASRLAKLVGSRHYLKAFQGDDPLQMNLVDAAIARPLSPDVIMPQILGIGSPAGTVVGELGMPVQKSGRTTGLTKGKITQVDMTVQVMYGTDIALFTDQLQADAACGGGDSGSAVLNEVELVGLLFAGPADGSSLIMSRFENVVAELGLDAVFPFYAAP